MVLSPSWGEPPLRLFEGVSMSLSHSWLGKPPYPELREEMPSPKQPRPGQDSSPAHGEVSSLYAHRCDRKVSEPHDTLQLLVPRKNGVQTPTLAVTLPALLC